MAANTGAVESELAAPVVLPDAVPKRRASHREVARAAFVALRPRQWIKNLAVLAALVFAGEVDSPTAWINALFACAAYCIASSASYLVNDVRDAPADRLHPVKRFRPVASGALGSDVALALAGVLGLASCIMASRLGAGSLAFLATFVLLQASYTLVLKSVAIVDVAVIAALFLVRAAAGAEAIDVRISGWLLVSTVLLASLLGFAKRRAELALKENGPLRTRPSLSRYSVVALDRLLIVLTAITLGIYTCYAALAHRPAMLVTVPFVAAGLLRYLALVRRNGRGEEPETVLLTDVLLLSIVSAWAVTAAVLLAAT